MACDVIAPLHASLVRWADAARRGVAAVDLSAESGLARWGFREGLDY